MARGVRIFEWSGSNDGGMQDDLSLPVLFRHLAIVVVSYSPLLTFSIYFCNGREHPSLADATERAGLIERL